MSYLDESLAWWDKWLKGKDTDALDCPMIQAWVEDSMRPNCRRPVSEGRWVGMKSWPTDEVGFLLYTRGFVIRTRDLRFWYICRKNKFSLIKYLLVYIILSVEGKFRNSKFKSSY